MSFNLVSLKFAYSVATFVIPICIKGVKYTFLLMVFVNYFCPYIENKENSRANLWVNSEEYEIIKHIKFLKRKAPEL